VRTCWWTFINLKVRHPFFQINTIERVTLYRELLARWAFSKRSTWAWNHPSECWRTLGCRAGALRNPANSPGNGATRPRRSSGVREEKRRPLRIDQSERIFGTMNKPLISVAMVVCNVEKFLAESIESILGQTFRDFEFIILDFGSTDQSKAIASNYAANESRIRLHEIPYCGLPEARNAACRLAEGQYIAIQDADDISLPNRLKWEVEFMESRPEVGFLGGAAEWVNAEGRSLWVDNVLTNNCELQSALLTCCPFIHTSVLMRKKAFALVGGYRLVFPQAQDHDLWLRISEHFQCANLKQAVVKYRVHPNQLSLDKRRKQILASLGARASALARRTEGTEPLNSVQEITSAVLLRMGVTHARQQAEIFREYRNWVRNLFVAGEYSVALKAAMEVLGSDCEDIDQRIIADLRLNVARLYWKQKRFFRCFVAACHAVITKPAIARDLFESLLRRIKIA
jgi:glycosyltransferase involved in cell wall biosynthesis